MKAHEHISSQPQLIDRFGRAHTYLRLSLTEFCNFRCRYCVDPHVSEQTNHHALLNASEIVQLASVFTELGIQKIRLTGGEPLIRKDVEEIIIRLSQLPVELALSTNGFLLPAYRETLKQVGLKKINLSLDSLRPERFRAITGVDACAKITHLIPELIADGVSLRLNCVMMKGVNDDEIIDLVKLTEHYPIRLRFIEFMPFTGNAWSKEKVLSTDDLIREIQKQYPLQKMQDEQHATDSAYFIPNFKGNIGFISTVSHPFCSSCNRIRVTADGKLKNCLFGADETDLRALIPFKNELIDAIRNSVMQKHAQYGGQSLSDHMLNRSMLHIGG